MNLNDIAFYILLAGMLAFFGVFMWGINLGKPKKDPKANKK